MDSSATPGKERLGSDLTIDPQQPISSAPSSGNFTPQNKYDGYDEEQLEALASAVSPKVSELLKEESLALDGLLTHAWSDEDSDAVRRKRGANESEGESSDEDWLDAAQGDLVKELALANDGFDEVFDEEGGFHFDSVDVEKEQGSPKPNPQYDEDWSKSIHQYYNANTEQQNTPSRSSRNGDVGPPRDDHAYNLQDHAVTLDISRSASERGLYKRPLLSRNELETTKLVSLPEWITRPGGEVSSRGREAYMKRILDSTVEYIEAPKSKRLRALFSGWSPGPGEQHEGGNGERLADSGDGRQRVMAYSSGTNADLDQTLDDDASEEFTDIDGTQYSVPSYRPTEPLPVRTVAIRCRPDVLCGSVMDALTTSVERLGGEITKRQGGHLRAVLPGRKLRIWLPGEWERENSRIREDFSEASKDGSDEFQAKTEYELVQHDDAIGHEDGASVSSGISTLFLGSKSRRKGPKFASLPPYVVDAQLLTKKVGKECQRQILVRIYRIHDIRRVSLDVEGEVLDAATPMEVEQHSVGTHAECERSVNALKEAAALVQRIKAVGATGFSIEPPQSILTDDATISSVSSSMSYLKSISDAVYSPITYLTSSSPAANVSSRRPLTVIELMSSELLRKAISSPSVGTTSRSALRAAKQKSYGIYPALSKEDFPLVKASWVFLKDCIGELDSRCLSYTSLGIQPLFQYPALPTLDAHFINQIKALCRESMIVSLIKAASDLEVYAREFEVSTGNLDQILRPTYESYKLAPPRLPTPVPLTAYPLDYHETSPPWGPHVKEALESASASSNEEGGVQSQLSSFEQSAKVISSVVAGFQRQNDMEQGARLGRKNLQVMDRLAKMQSHKRDSIARIRDSYGENYLATSAADDFHSLRNKSKNIGSLTDRIHASPNEVPLLICNVLVGNAAGTCYVTHSHLLFNTQLVPILGGNRVNLFSIMDVDVTIHAPSKSLLSPLPASISLTTAVFGNKSTTREEVYNFIPSIGARRFAKFVEVLRDVATEDPDALKFSDRGGLLYMDNAEAT